MLAGARYFSFLIDDGTVTMTTADEFTIAINTGSTYPAETFARGQDVVVTRSGNFLGPFAVRMTLRPVRMAYGEPGGCNSSGICGMTAPTLDPAQLNGQINNLGYIVDPADKAAMRGFDLASNTDWVSTPLQLARATNSIVLDVANSHFEPDGATVFRGAAEFRIPKAMLRRLYHVDDPADADRERVHRHDGLGARRDRGGHQPGQRPRRNLGPDVLEAPADGSTATRGRSAHAIFGLCALRRRPSSSPLRLVAAPGLAGARVHRELSPGHAPSRQSPELQTANPGERAHPRAFVQVQGARQEPRRPRPRGQDRYSGCVQRPSEWEARRTPGLARLEPLALSSGGVLALCAPIRVAAP